MSLPYFENAVDSGYLKNPNDYFRSLQQAAITGSFDCTSAKYTVQEQDAIGASTYHNIEVWLDYIVGTTSSGVKQGIDFTQLMFENIDHETYQGLYYIFDDNYHISYFYNKYDGLEKAIAVRKCNNSMKIVDPKNGAIFAIPCVVDYDMTSPSQQVSSYIITPNNHAVVMVQGNEDTLRLFKLNTRYMFNGRPFKLLAYQNALNENLSNQKPTLLYLDLYLDELHDKDDIVNNLAYNGEFNYSISIDSDNMKLQKGANGNLTATVTVNGEEGSSDVVWNSSDPTCVIISEDGQYSVIGNTGTSAVITAVLKGNTQVGASITIEVVDSELVQPKIILSPVFDKIRQYETLTFNVEALYGSEVLANVDEVNLSLDENEEVLTNQYLTIASDNGQWQITGNNITGEDNIQTLYVTVSNSNPEINTVSQFNINVVSMFG